ncbi:hypothetical protein Rm378p075 [Rhodothermus phage RM378]|uniref:hypothetical protein n=1 Tax=Rhodothermus phage RM378 TaxID=148943 RepID=UPI000018F650|nr:hypothetical protein Rm378p075 [Rhodothermus phage RM378]
METINTDTFVLNKPLFNGLSQQFIKTNLPPNTPYYYNTNYFILTSEDLTRTSLSNVMYQQIYKNFIEEKLRQHQWAGELLEETRKALIKTGKTLVLLERKLKSMTDHFFVIIEVSTLNEKYRDIDFLFMGSILIGARYDDEVYQWVATPLWNIIVTREMYYYFYIHEGKIPRGDGMIFLLKETTPSFELKETISKLTRDVLGGFDPTNQVYLILSDYKNNEDIIRWCVRSFLYEEYGGTSLINVLFPPQIEYFWSNVIRFAAYHYGQDHLNPIAQYVVRKFEEEERRQHPIFFDRNFKAKAIKEAIDHLNIADQIYDYLRDAAYYKIEDAHYHYILRKLQSDIIAFVSKNLEEAIRFLSGYFPIKHKIENILIQKDLRHVIDVQTFIRIAYGVIINKLNMDEEGDHFTLFIKQVIMDEFFEYVKPEIEKYLKDVRDDRDFVEYFKEVVAAQIMYDITLD